jgi:hypothetical protein
MTGEGSWGLRFTRRLKRPLSCFLNPRYPLLSFCINAICNRKRKKTKINQNVIHLFFYFNLVLPDCEFFVKSETTRFSFCLAKQNADAIFFFFFVVYLLKSPSNSSQQCTKCKTWINRRQTLCSVRMYMCVSKIIALMKYFCF